MPRGKTESAFVPRAPERMAWMVDRHGFPKIPPGKQFRHRVRINAERISETVR